MKIETKEIYKCDHCNKLYQIKNWCAKHEISCSKNPENDRPCFGCKHLDMVTEDLYYDTFQGESVRKVNIFRCTKLDNFLHPPKVEFKGQAFDFGAALNESLPKECKDYKSYSDFIDFDSFFNDKTK